MSSNEETLQHVKKKDENKIYYYWGVCNDTKKFKGFIKAKDLNEAKKKSKRINVIIPKQIPIKEGKQ